MTTALEAATLIPDLERRIPELLAQHRVPGLSLALLRSAETVWTPVFGVRNAATGEPVTATTPFEAASLSKPVFAYAALQLCAEGVLQLDTPLTAYLPEAYIADEPHLAQVTMRRVLSHTSGLPNWRPKGQPLTFRYAPGERFSYSGEGYVYLQAVVAHVTGRDPVEFVQSTLLDPLGMLDSRFVWTGEETTAAVGHDELGEAAEKQSWPTMNAAASLHTTPTDFAKFVTILLHPPDDRQRELVAEMLREQVHITGDEANGRVGWGLGWGLQQTDRDRAFWHWGDNRNYRAFALGYPESGAGVVIMTNGRNGQRVIDDILYNVVGGPYPALDWLGK